MHRLQLTLNKLSSLTNDKLIGYKSIRAAAAVVVVVVIAIVAI
jgi:hypothetical protein